MADFLDFARRHVVLLDGAMGSQIQARELTLDEALAMIREGRGAQFDPECVDAFMLALPSTSTTMERPAADAPARRGSPRAATISPKSTS